MSMINLVKCQAVYNGNISDVVHTAVMENGYFVNLGSMSATTDLYNVAVPATATLATEEVLLIFNDETQYAEGTSISDYSIAIGEGARAYHLTVGDMIDLDDTLFDGTSVANQYLIPQDGDMKLVASATLGSTRFALKVVSKGTIGYDKSASTLCRVVKA